MAAFRIGSIVCLVSIVTLNSFSQMGTLYPSERTTYIDNITGATVTVLTSPKTNDNKLYQTHPSWLADGRHVVFVSGRAGEPHLFSVDEASGAIVQLTDGPSISRACLDRRANRMLVIQDDVVQWIDTGSLIADAMQNHVQQRDSYITKIAPLPAHYEIRDMPTLDANSEWMYACAKTKGSEDDWFLAKLELSTGRWTRFLDTGFMPGHIQANPAVPGLIMYCHETGGDAPNRIWVVRADGSGNQPFYEETPSEWVTHEVWWGMDRALFTKATLKGSPCAAVSVRFPDRRAFVHLNEPCWHIAGTPDQRFAIGDTMEGNIFLIDIATGKTQLLTQGHRPNRKVHAHQSISPEGKRLLFASGKLGNCDLMTVEIPVTINNH